MYAYILILLVLLCLTTNAQQDTLIDPVDYLEYLADESSVTEDESQILESIESLLISPLAINEASLDKLLTIPILDVQSAHKIIEYRNKHGSFFAKNELYNVENVGKEIIRLLLPLITLESRYESFTKKNEFNIQPGLKINFRNRIITDIQDRQGFANDSYAGSKYKQYSRLRVNYGDNYSAGYLVEKDSGEKYLNDFQSFFLQMENLFDSRIILGDYLCQFGQGLAVWSPYANSKGSAALSSVTRRDRKFYPYTGSDENQFFRGIVYAGNLWGFNLSAFYSSNYVDASTNPETDAVTSLPIDGYHRTENEILKKDNLVINTFGARLDYSAFTNSIVSILHIQSNLNKPLQADNMRKRFSCTSIAYSFSLNKLYFSGETAISNSAIATVNNLVFQISEDFSTILSVRNYPANYSFLFSNAMGEGSNTSNEFGIYTGFKLKTILGVFNFYYDQFKFPSATFKNSLPSSGHETAVYYSNRINSSLTINFRYFSETKEVTEEFNNSQMLFDRNTKKYRAESITVVNKKLRLKTRIEYLSYSLHDLNITEKGFLAFQDVNIKMLQNFEIYARLIFFNTESYNSRLYEYENDLIGVLSNPALYGKGLKWYVLLRYNVLQGLFLSVKYSELLKPNEKSMGTGLSAIPNNLDNKISVQLEYLY